MQIKGVEMSDSPHTKSSHPSKQPSIDTVKSQLPSVNNSTLFKPIKERKVHPYAGLEDLIV
jgi:hypothetical protein